MLSIVLDLTLKHIQEIGSSGIWTVSSSKPAHGVANLRDGNLDTYWQSDGGTPHSILVEFGERVLVSHVALYLDYGLDESYTPQHIVLKAGLQEPELTDVLQGTVKKATGWLIIDIQQESTYTIHSLHGDEKDEKEDEERRGRS